MSDPEIKVKEGYANDLTAALNTDKEIWRKIKGDFYSPSIHITKDNGIGLNVGGSVIVMPIEEWHKTALVVKALELRLTKTKEALENIVKHYEIIAEGLTPHSTVYSIAKKALKEIEER